MFHVQKVHAFHNFTLADGREVCAEVCADYSPAYRGTLETPPEPDSMEICAVDASIAMESGEIAAAELAAVDAEILEAIDDDRDLRESVEMSLRDSGPDEPNDY